MTSALFVINLLLLIGCGGGQKLMELDEVTWPQLLKGEWMVEFYAPWCPACKALEPRWREFAHLSSSLGIKVASIDVTTSPGLSGRFMVTALPTIFHVREGQFRQYKGARDVDSLSLFIEEEKWKQVDPVSSWKAPNSLQMTVVASFFKLSQTLRNLHQKFTQEFGLPTIASYLIFAIATIILGACLGLILVCAIDLIFPQKPLGTVQKKTDDPQEIEDEDIKDDLEDDGAAGDSDEPVESDTSKPRKRKTKKRDM